MIDLNEFIEAWNYFRTHRKCKENIEVNEALIDLSKAKLAEEMVRIISISKGANSKELKKEHQISGYSELFFQEIIQNANDQIRLYNDKNNEKRTECKVEFSKTDGVYTVSCEYADNGFELKDIFAYFDTNVTGKDDNDGTGGFGVGIKTIFSFAESFRMESNIIVEYKPGNVSVEFNKDFAKTTRFSFSFSSDCNCKMNKNKLADFIDKLYDHKLHENRIRCLAENTSEVVFDIRSLLFMKDGGIETLIFCCNGKQFRVKRNASSIVISDNDKLLAERVSIEIKEFNYLFSYIVLHEIEEKSPITHIAISLDGNITNKIFYFSNYYVDCDGSDTSSSICELLIDTTAVTLSRTEIDKKVFNLEKALLRAGALAALAAMRSRYMDSPDIIYTWLICVLAVSGKKFFEETDEYTQNILQNAYVGKGNDKVFLYNEEKIFNLLKDDYSSNSEDKSNPHKLFDEILDKNKTIGKIEDNAELSDEENTIREIIKCCCDEKNKGNSVLYCLPVLKTVMDVLNKVEITPENFSGVSEFLEGKGNDYIKQLFGRCGFDMFDRNGYHTDAAVVLYFTSDNDEEYASFSDRFGELKAYIRNLDFSYGTMKLRRKCYHSNSTGSYYYIIDNKSNKSEQEANAEKALAQLIDLLSMKAVLERLCFDSSTCFLVSVEKGFFSGDADARYLEKNEDRSFTFRSYVELSRVIASLKNHSLIKQKISADFNDLKRMFELFIKILDRLSEIQWYISYNDKKCYQKSLLSNVLGYLTELCKLYTFKPKNSISDFINWFSETVSQLSKSMEKLMKVVGNDLAFVDKAYFFDAMGNLLGAIRLDISECKGDNDLSDNDLADISEFIERIVFRNSESENHKVVLLNPIVSEKTVTGFMKEDKLSLSFSFKDGIGYDYITKVLKITDEKANTRPLYIFVGNSDSRTNVSKKIMDILNDALKDMKFEKRAGFIENFIYTGRTYNVNSSDFNALSSRNSANVKYRYQQYRNRNGWKNRIDESDISIDRVRNILASRSSYDRHCPFCGSAFDSSGDSNSSLDNLITAIIPISKGEKTEFLPVLMCKTCFKRLRHITHATISEENNKATLKISLEYSDCSRIFLNDALSLELSADNLSLFKVLNSLPENK